MAQFNNLHEASVALCDILQHRIDPALDVLPAPPIEDATSSAEAIRVTLLWLTPQPTHQNDPPIRQPDGTIEPPPPTLSAFYLVTTYGTTTSGEPIQAYNHLGQVVRVFDNESRLELPNPPATTIGEGALSVVLVPTAADLMEKIYTPLQMRHRPWVLYEVGPIQLPSRAATIGTSMVVHPRGVNLRVEASAQPRIDSVIPARIAMGGRIRLNAEYSGNIDHVRIGDEVIPLAALSIPVPGGPVLVTLPGMIDAGIYDVTLSVDGLVSKRVTLKVTDTTISSADAPTELGHSLASDLVITGRTLISTVNVVLWPVSGINSPNDVIQLAVTAVSDIQMTVTSAEFATQAVRTGRYHLAIQAAPNVFTPYVQIELIP